MSNDQIVETDNVEGIICTNYSERQFLFPGQHQFWMPNKKEVLVGEPAIEEYLTQLRPEPSPNLAKKLSQYRRQYVGIIVEGKKRIHYIFFRSLCH